MGIPRKLVSSKLFFLNIVVLFFVQFTGAAQTQPLKDKDSSEKVFIHYNKNSYQKIDSLFFDAYIINTKNFLSFSNHFYIGIADEQGKIVIKNHYPITSSNAYGSISLQELEYKKCYFIFAYTPSMLGMQQIYFKKLVFDNVIEYVDSSKIDLSVFVENNKLIPDVPNDIFLKASYMDKYPAKLNLYLKDDKSAAPIKITTNDKGLAGLNFIPKKLSSYSIIDIKGKIYHRFELLEQATLGFKVQTKFSKNIFDFEVFKSRQVKLALDSFMLIAYYNDSSIYEMPISFGKYYSIAGGLNIPNIQSGLYKFSLYDNTKNVVATSYLNISDDDKVQTVILDSVNSVLDNKASLSLKFADSSQKIISISIEKMDTIHSYGNTFEPSYTKKMGPKIELKNTLMKNIKLENILKKDTFVNEIIEFVHQNNSDNIISAQSDNIKLDDNYLINISGQVMDSLLGKSVKAGLLKIYQFSSDSNFQIFEIRVKDNGSFLLDSMLFTGKTTFFYKYFDEKYKERTVKIKLDYNNTDVLMDSLCMNYLLQMILPCNDVVLFDEASPSKLAAQTGNVDTGSFKELEIVKLKTYQRSKKELLDKKYTKGVYSMEPMVFIDNINSPTSNISLNAFDFIINRINNLVFQNGHFANRRNYSLLGKGGVKTGTLEFWEVGITIDEFPAPLEYLYSLRASDIAMVKFFGAGWVGATSEYPGGVLAIYTKKFEDKTLKVPDQKTMLSFDYNGFSDWGNRMENANKALFKNKKCVYWNPNLFFENSVKSFAFDLDNIETGVLYKLSINGINSNLETISYEKLIEFK